MKQIHPKASTTAAIFLAVFLTAAGVYGETTPCPPEQIQRLLPICQDQGTFGEAVSLLDDRLAIGRFDSGGGRVTTHVFDPQVALWQHEADIRPSDLTSFDAFGHAVELFYDAPRGRWLLVAGSPSKSDIAPSAGKVYVFALDGSGLWVEQAEVLADIVIPYGWFGNELAWVTAGDRIFLIVGAPGSNGHQLIGSVYVFEQNGQGDWGQLAHLQAPDGTAEDAFGWGLAASEEQGTTVLAVGASAHVNLPARQPGTVYFYRFDDLSEIWVLESQFEARDPTEQDQFAKDVALGGITDPLGFTHRAAVGCPNEGGNGSSSGPGGVYLYLRTADGVWQEEAHLNPPVANDPTFTFGTTVHLDPARVSRLLAGAPNSRQFGVSSGSAYVYERDTMGGAWLQTQAIFGREADDYDGFAADLAFGNGASAGTAVVGALGTQCPGGSQFDAVGAVYSFDLEPGEGGACPPPVLTLQKVPDCSSGSGGELEVRWFQATPDRSARVAILYGRRTGEFVIPNGNPCAGTALGLGAQDLQVAFTGSAGQFGAGRVKTNIPRAACGGYLQLLDVTRCEVSNVVRIE